MVDVPHDGDDWRPCDLITGWRLIRQQILVDIRAADELGGMTQLFHNQYGCVLIDDLVDRHHRAHVEQDFDNFIALHCHFLRQFRHGNAVRNLDLTDNRCGWSLEAVLSVRADADRAAASWRFAFAPATLIARNVQFLAPVASLLCRLAFLLVFLLGTALAGILLSFFNPRSFLGSDRSGFFSGLPRL
jgi:hypothetical protein